MPPANIRYEQPENPLDNPERYWMSLRDRITEYVLQDGPTHMVRRIDVIQRHLGELRLGMIIGPDDRDPEGL